MLNSLHRKMNSGQVAMSSRQIDNTILDKSEREPNKGSGGTKPTIPVLVSVLMLGYAILGTTSSLQQTCTEHPLYGLFSHGYRKGGTNLFSRVQFFGGSGRV